MPMRDISRRRRCLRHDAVACRYREKVVFAGVSDAAAAFLD